ncbi:hypothetical protein EVAR_51861_1 [Eumeta japonica]|uniref:Uncharacterized protein n=1 Tax=Eumeta variegata TaxID=151549 RepID=A0A4C1YNI8_EUMVA|nr:hypothetical protein EVAR_51861_1 [Eumeta japonica]
MPLALNLGLPFRKAQSRLHTVAYRPMDLSHGRRSVAGRCATGCLSVGRREHLPRRRRVKGATAYPYTEPHTLLIKTRGRDVTTRLTGAAPNR